LSALFDNDRKHETKLPSISVDAQQAPYCLGCFVIVKKLDDDETPEMVFR